MQNFSLCKDLTNEYIFISKMETFVVYCIASHRKGLVNVNFYNYFFEEYNFSFWRCYGENKPAIENIIEIYFPT